MAICSEVLGSIPTQLRSHVPDRCRNYGSDRPFHPIPKHGDLVVGRIPSVYRVLMVSALHRRLLRDFGENP